MTPEIQAASHSVMSDAIVVLASAAIVIPLFHRLRVSPVLGFMLVGLLVGPFGLGALVGTAPWLAFFTISDRHRIEPVAELGVVLLLFMIGLELSFARILVMRRLVFGMGGLQVLLGTLLVAGTCWLLGMAPRAAFVVGIALAMSSTAVVAQVLAEEKRVTGRVARAAFAVLLFQDIAVVPIMFALGVLGAGDMSAWNLALAIGQAVGAIVGIVLLGRLVLRPLFRGVARTQSPELFMAACLLVVLVTGVAGAAAGLSMELGALIAGLLLAETEYRRQIEITVEPFKGLLLGVFLISIGLNLDLGRVVAQPLAVLGGAVALVAAKTAIVAGLGRVFGLRLPVAGPAGMLLAPGGEFSFVILGLATTLQVLSADQAGFAYILAAVTMATIPLLSRLGTWAFPTRAVAVDSAMLLADAPSDGHEAPAVIVAGFGRVGQTVGALLTRHGIAWLALDTDIKRVGRARQAGHPVYYGDMKQPELLRRAGLETARAVVVTVDDRGVADSITALASAERSDLLVIVRARDATHAAALYRLGATDAVPETIEASLQLAEAVLVDLGIAMGPVLVSIHDQRAAFQAEIRAKVPGADIKERGRTRLRPAPAE